MVAQSGERYRKLPGRRRGLWNGAGLWMGSDHILSVRSMRFREEYKRFYLRDVQAIVVARAPRFHVSTRGLAIAAVWVAAWLFTRELSAAAITVLWVLAAALAAAWFYVSAACSCRCRIYTAVSSDELPSVYRTWTGRKLLAQVQPRIWEVQGVLEGEWAEAAEQIEVGNIQPKPPRETASGTGFAHPIQQPADGPTRTWASDLFVASLFVRGGVNLLTLNSLTPTVLWVLNVLLLLQAGAAVLVLVQHYRGALGSRMQKLAIATLVVMGALYYTGVFGMGVAAGIAGARGPAAIRQNSLELTSGYRLLREIGAAASLLLGVTGMAISQRSDS
jgi:hypothetical protein